MRRVFDARAPFSFVLIPRIALVQIGTRRVGLGLRPADIILVHAGLYKYNRYEYTNNAFVNRSTPYDGTYYLTGTGTPEKPIVIKAAGDGEVIFDGAGNFTLFDVTAGDYHYFEGLTIRNTEYGIRAGIQFLRGSKGLAVKRCRFEDVGNGVWTNDSRSSNFYIAALLSKITEKSIIAPGNH